MRFLKLIAFLLFNLTSGKMCTLDDNIFLGFKNDLDLSKEDVFRKSLDIIVAFFMPPLLSIILLFLLLVLVVCNEPKSLVSLPPSINLVALPRIVADGIRVVEKFGEFGTRNIFY